MTDLGGDNPKHFASRWDDHTKAAIRHQARADLRIKLAVIIHNSWSVEPFNEALHPEDLTAADAVIHAFPQLLT